jgi:hypothetical protein
LFQKPRNRNQLYFGTLAPTATAAAAHSLSEPFAIIAILLDKNEIICEPVRVSDLGEYNVPFAPHELLDGALPLLVMNKLHAEHPHVQVVKVDCLEHVKLDPLDVKTEVVDPRPVQKPHVRLQRVTLNVHKSLLNKTSVILTYTTLVTVLSK